MSYCNNSIVPGLETIVLLLLDISLRGSPSPYSISGARLLCHVCISLPRIPDRYSIHDALPPGVKSTEDLSYNELREGGNAPDCQPR